MKTYKTILNFTVLTIILFTVFSINGLSQTSSTNSWFFGGKAGTNFATMKYTGDIYPYETKLFPRLMVGLFVEKNITSDFSIRPELLYIQRGVDIEDLGVAYTLKANYLDIRIPFIYSFNSLRRSMGFIPYLMVSPNLGFVVGGNIENQGYTADINKADIKSNDIGLAPGLGVKFPMRIGDTKFYFGIEAQYNFGLTNNFGSGNNFNRTTACGTVGERKNQGIELAVTISVPLGKSSDKIVYSDRSDKGYKNRIDTLYRDLVKVSYVDKPCYEAKEIVSFLKQGIDIHNKNICIYDIQYDINKSELNASSKRKVDDIVLLMKNMPEFVVKINGHTDNKGTKQYNQELSEKRAKVVYDYMIKRGIDKNRLSYEGFGLERPIATNDTEEGRSQNRRVEFEIISY